MQVEKSSINEIGHKSTLNYMPPLNTPEKLNAQKTNFDSSILLNDDVEENIEDKNHFGAKALIALAILNGPTDIEEFVGVYNIIRNRFRDLNAEGYNNSLAQHPFSFFRGTLLHDYLNPYSEKCLNQDLSAWVLRNDISLKDTTFGKKILNKLGVEEAGRVVTDIKSLTHTEQNPKCVEALQFSSRNAFGDLTARTLTRTSKIGVIVLAILEAIKIANNTLRGKSFKEEVTESSIEFLGTVLLGGYLGAYGAKKFGTLGSIVGLGLGALTGSIIPKLIYSRKKKVEKS